MRLSAGRVWQILAPLWVILFGFIAFQVGRHWWGKDQFEAAERALERRDFQEAGAHLKVCLDIWPWEPSVRLLAAQTTRRRGDYAEAQEHLRLLKKQTGPTDDWKREHQLLLLHQGDLVEAPMLLALCSSQPEAKETPLVLEAFIEGSLKHFNTGTGSPNTVVVGAEEPLSDLGRIAEAIEEWLRLRPSQADQVQGLLWRGQVCAARGDKDAAEADFRQALARDPDHFEARLRLVVVVGFQAPEEAVAHLEILRRRSPNDREVGLSLASFRRQLGQLEEAGQILDELLAATPNDVQLLIERGYVALNAQQMAEAERWLRKAHDLAPDVPEVNLALSGWLTKAGRPDEAKTYYERGLLLIEQGPRR